MSPVIQPRQARPLVLRPLPELFHAWQDVPALRGPDWSKISLRLERAPRDHFGVSTGASFVQPDGTGQGWILVRAGSIQPIRVATLLHEMAHVRAWGEIKLNAHHAGPWMETYALACEQISGCRPLARRRDLLDLSVAFLLAEV